ncbi:major facilitator superfamily domain-containing protein [Aspergillus minisclerotigenes]|uniref:Major facilitator superfamily domain-containing protein n=1 Tax=Aspergillus minisclerotigenes TaxID=656917 RepID=A0A5N6JIX8_9EURO|nr:major facilitator superfamily domain-containing protein [Aspergillus minisclerotigenes]
MQGSKHDSDGAQYAFPTWRKCLILTDACFVAFTSSSALCSMFPATAQIAAELSTTVETLNIANACVQIAMGISLFVWQPIRSFIGRRNSYLLAILILFCFSIGAALAINASMFIAMRIIVGITGTFLLVAGQELLAETFDPVGRGAAFGYMQIGNTTGLTIGPAISGIIVSFTRWRIIYWLQVGLAGLGLILSLLFIPNEKGKSESVHGSISRLAALNPVNLLKPLVYPNIVITGSERCPEIQHILTSKQDIACGFLVFFQFIVLTSIPHIINPRFHFTTPLVSGLFYLAPGGGFVLGSLVGGIVSDRTTKRYIAKRDGIRLPQDRLNGSLPMWLGVMPVSMVIYGWTLDLEVGGMAVPIISVFFAAGGIVVAFNGLNTYTAEALPEHRFAAISGKYIIQYGFGAVSTAAVVPLIDAIGVGLVFTTCAIISVIGGVGVFLVAKYGLQMQNHQFSSRV